MVNSIRNSSTGQIGRLFRQQLHLLQIQWICHPSQMHLQQSAKFKLIKRTKILKMRQIQISIKETKLTKFQIRLLVAKEN